MPVMNGLEAAREIGRIAPNTTLVLFTLQYPRRSIETSRGRWCPARLLKTRFLFASGRLAENNGGGQSILTYPIAHDMRNSVLFFSPLSLLSLHHFKALTRGLLQSRSVDDLDIPAG